MEWAHICLTDLSRWRFPCPCPHSWCTRAWSRPPPLSCWWTSASCWLRACSCMTVEGAAAKTQTGLSSESPSSAGYPHPCPLVSVLGRALGGLCSGPSLEAPAPQVGVLILLHLQLVEHPLPPPRSYPQSRLCGSPGGPCGLCLHLQPSWPGGFQAPHCLRRLLQRAPGRPRWSPDRCAGVHGEPWTPWHACASPAPLSEVSLGIVPGWGRYGIGSGTPPHGAGAPSVHPPLGVSGVSLDDWGSPDCPRSPENGSSPACARLPAVSLLAPQRPPAHPATTGMSASHLVSVHCLAPCLLYHFVHGEKLAFSCRTRGTISGVCQRVCWRGAVYNATSEKHLQLFNILFIGDQHYKIQKTKVCFTTGFAPFLRCFRTSARTTTSPPLDESKVK